MENDDMGEIAFSLQFRTVHLGGIIRVTAPAWDGVVEVVPREMLAAHLAANHVDRIGAYLTLGDDMREGPYAYAGSGHLPARLTRHLNDATKGAFTRAILFYAPSGWLHNARAANLEAYLYRTMCTVGQVRVLNQQTPSEPRLDGDGDLAAMEFWRRIATEALKHVGAGILMERLPRVYAPKRQSCGCDREEMFRLWAPYEAYLVARGSDLHIRAGSMGRALEGERWAEERGTGYRRRRELIDEGLLKPLADGEHYIATANIPVTSPSQASCMLATQEAAGTTAWRHVVTGESFSDYLRRKESERHGRECEAA